MAFGITRDELNRWKEAVSREEIAFLTHYWHDPRFPHIRTVTKVGCSNSGRLSAWCISHGLNPHFIHKRSPFPHFDLMGPKQIEVLRRERLWDHLEHFRIGSEPT